MNILPKLIRQNRKRKKISQKELAKKIGCTQSAISKWENGKKIPGGIYMLKLSKILKMKTKLLS